MIYMIKEMKNLKTSEEVLAFAKAIKAIKDVESIKGMQGLSNCYLSFEKLERIAYKIAVQKANTPEELELCAVTVELNDCGIEDPDEWAEQIRIQSYGLECYLEREFKTPSYQSFVDFTSEVGIDNPLEELEQVIVH